MDLYVTDQNTRALVYIENYESAIWTERYHECGDFEFTIALDNPAVPYIQHENFIKRVGSDRLMMIENIDTNWSIENDSYLKVSGRSFEAFLEHRVATHPYGYTTSDLTTNFKQFAGAPSHIMHAIVRDYCIDYTWVARDYPYGRNTIHGDLLYQKSIIPSMIAPDVGAFGMSAIYISMHELEIYSFLVDMSKTYDVGFKIESPGNATYNFIFHVYRGTDKPNAIFSLENSDISSYRKYSSTKNYKNRVLPLAYKALPGSTNYAYPSLSNNTRVWYDYETTAATWYTDTYSAPKELQSDHILTWLEYRPLWIKHDPWRNLQDVPEYYRVFAEGCKELIATYRKINILEVEINPNSAVKYGADYNLGDTIRVEIDGILHSAKVLEYTISSDETGIREWPTLDTIEVA